MTDPTWNVHLAYRLERIHGEAARERVASRGRTRTEAPRDPATSGPSPWLDERATSPVDAALPWRAAPGGAR